MHFRIIMSLVMASLLLASCASKPSNKYAEKYFKKCAPIKLYERDQVRFRRSVRRDHVYWLGVGFIYPVGEPVMDYRNKFPLLVKLDIEGQGKCHIPQFGCPVVKLKQAPSPLRFGVKIVRVDEPEVIYEGEMIAKFINTGSFGIIDMPFYKPEVPKGVYDRFRMRKGIYDITVENHNSSSNFIDERSCISFFEETHK